MDPLTIGVLVAIGAGGAAALARWRKGRRADRGTPPPGTPAPSTGEDRGAYRIGDVLSHLGEEYWLAGELSLIREGSPVLRLFPAPERGQDRWVVLAPATGSLYVLRVDARLAALGWPGVEVPLGGRVLRSVERGSCAITSAGEVPPGWDGLGRYAVFSHMEDVAVVVELGASRLALAGKNIPLRLVEKIG
jgi:hypothetical protein